MLEEWLRSIGLEAHYERFRAERVTLADLCDLSEADLRELGLSLGERRRFRRAVVERWPAAEARAEEQRDRLRRLTQGERRPLTAMFVGHRQFHELSEQIGDEELLTTVRAFRELCESAVGRTGGRIAKFLGDGVLAYFCYPVAHQNDPERAVRAGLEIAASAGEIRPLPNRPLTVRIGIATGSLILGELFEHGETAFSATGSILNLAARLQGIAPPGGVVVGEATRERIVRQFELVALGGRELKGFREPVQCWRVLGPARAGEPEAGPAPRLHGRARELALLDRLWEAVSAGESRAVLLRGEAGVGKSALVEQFLRARRTAGDAVLTIAGSDLDRDTPLFPVSQLLRGGGGGVAGQQRLARLGATSRALLARLGGLPHDPAPIAVLSPPRQRDGLLEAAANLLLMRAEGALCLVVEDAHWLDPSTTELLERLVDRAARPVERASPAATLLLITARLDFAPAWPRDAAVREIVLERLGEDAIRAMAADLLDGTPMPEALLARIVERTDGVPLFVEAVSRQFRQRAVASSGAAELEDVPASLREALMARLDRAGVAKALAQAASVIGYQIDRTVLGAVEALQSTDFAERLRTLVERSVLRAEDAAGASYAFRHALVRDVAYDSLLSDARRHLHARVADALQSIHPGFAEEQPAVLALHLAKAGRAQAAARCWLEAARQAVASSALTEATRLLRRGLDALQGLEPSPERTRLELDLLGLLGPALMALNGPGAEETRAHYERSYTLCQTLPEAPAHFPLYWGWWRVSQDFHTMQARSGWLLGRARTQRDPGTLMQAHHCNWASCYHVGAFDLCCEHIEAGLGLYGTADWSHHAALYGNHDARACAHGELAMVRWMQGRTDASFANHRESLDWAHRLGHLGSIIHSMDCALTFHAMRQAHAEAYAAAEALTTLTAEHGFADHEAKGHIYRGWAIAMQEDPAAGLAQLREGFARQQDIGTSEDFPIYACLQAEALMAAGDPERAAAELLAARAQFDASGLRIWLPEVLRVTAQALEATRSGVSVLPILAEAADIAAGQGVATLGLRIATERTRLLESQGDLHGAARALRDALAAVPDLRDEAASQAATRLARLQRLLGMRSAE